MHTDIDYDPQFVLFIEVIVSAADSSITSIVMEYGSFSFWSMTLTG